MCAQLYTGTGTLKLIAATYLEGGKVWWPKRARWLGEWEAELLVFDKGKHDDQVDAFSYAAMQISNKRSRTSLEGWTFDPDLIKPGICSFP